jgi:hypothetical protein
MGGSERVVPRCGSGTTPCWELVDAAGCPGRSLRISDPDRTAGGSVAKASCSTCVSVDDPACPTAP